MTTFTSSEKYVYMIFETFAVINMAGCGDVVSDYQLQF